MPDKKPKRGLGPSEDMKMKWEDMTPEERLSHSTASLSQRMPKEYKVAGNPELMGPLSRGLAKIREAAGYTTPFNQIRIHPSYTSDKQDLDNILTHEYTHVGQNQRRGLLSNVANILYETVTRAHPERSFEREASEAERKYKPGQDIELLSFDDSAPFGEMRRDPSTGKLRTLKRRSNAR